MKLGHDFSKETQLLSFSKGFFVCVCLPRWAPHAECHLVPLYWRESTKQSEWINSPLQENLDFWFWGNCFPSGCAESLMFRWNAAGYWVVLMQQRNLHKQRDVLKTWWKEAKTIFLPSESHEWQTADISQIEPFTQRQTDVLIVTATWCFICSKSTHEWRYLLNADWNSVDGERLFRGPESCTGSVYLIRPWLNPRPQKLCSLWMFRC